MRNFSKIVLRTILLFFFVIALLIISTIPYFHGEIYYYQDYKVRKSLSGKIDTLIIGSSQALRSIKPTVLNKELNIKSYNLSSPLMSMVGRYTMLKKEIERNPVKTVFFELSYDALTADRDNVLGFEGELYILGRLDNTLERLNFFKKAFKKKDYIKVLSDTIKRSKYAIEKTDDTPIIQYETYGYLPIKANDQSLTQREKKSIINTKLLNSKIREEDLKYLIKSIELCKKNNIRLVLIVSPITEKMILTYSNMDEVFSQYTKLANKYEIEYYDFNLDKRRFELYSEKTSFYDGAHMSESGAEIFSNTLSQTIKKINEGKDISNEFYESYNRLKELY